MNEPVVKEQPTIYQFWSEMIASVLKCQVSLLKAQWQVCVHVAGGGLAIVPPVAEKPLSSVKQLEATAIERIKSGLAPPREIYELPYRNRVDWSALPEWARPCDPELFEECGHEG